VHASVRALDDQQVAAVGNRPERRAQPPGVLERVVDPHLQVPRTPEHERRAAHALEVRTGVFRDERLARADDVGVER